MDKKYSTLQEMLINSFSAYKNEPALGYVDGLDMTYGEIQKEVQQQIFRLAKMGIKSGDKVAIVGANSINWVVSYFSILSMGAVAVPILPDFTSDEISNVLLHSESRLVFVSGKLVSKINEKAKAALSSMILLDNMGDLDKGSPTIDVKSVEAYSPMGSLSVDHFEVKPDDLASIIYTSGTTGSSKGVMLSHKNLSVNVHQCAEVEPLQNGEVFLSMLPLSHTLENTGGLMLPFSYGGLVKYLTKPPTPSVLIPALKKVRPTYLMTVPLVIEKIFKLQIKSKFNKSPVLRKVYRIPVFRKILHKMAGKKLYETFGGRLKFYGIGGAKLDASTERFLVEGKMPYAIGYGLTETAPFACGDGVKHTRFQSTGRPVQSIEMRINNPDPKTGEGEIWVKGENVMKGYYKEPEMTAKVLSKDGWFRTGDLGLLDKENYLYIKGRIKSVIVGSSGENIYPEEIESVINRFQHVLESVVVERKGKLIALVHFNIDELEGQFRHMKEEAIKHVEAKKEEAIKHVEAKKEELLLELREFVNSKVNSFSRIQLAVFQVDPFEKTATKKIKRYLYK